MKIVVVSAPFLLSLVLTLSLVEFASATYSGGVYAPSPGGGGEVERWCEDRCEVRCRVAGMHDRCLNYCGICCRDCKCVPSGTSGNKHECACYRDKLSSKGTPKCP
ncbi:PREDICTED: peamaclein [Tarenaya hassleriana]|uniref:peamaclein n=1 Tax=Tarenaya hassleriana TaxID=28532 RepID=UPI00053C8326|nr:PREDICTED: peamaclein [Tarenaya hassleriana]